jgi:phosphoserine/homoserine phosphotransferase
MSNFPVLVAMDLEGVLVPEVWIAVAEAIGIPELRLTTRDIADYAVLMRHRLGILRQHGLKLADLQRVIAGMEPLPGALAYMEWLSERYQNVILSDTFYEFAAPFMRKLGWPLLLCNSLEVDGDGMVTDYHMRILDGKRHAVLSLKNLNFRVIAMGDSFNDTAMLKEADAGILFRPPTKVRELFPQYPIAEDYETVRRLIEEFAQS